MRKQTPMVKKIAFGLVLPLLIVAALGMVLNSDAEVRNGGSALLDLNV